MIKNLLSFAAVAALAVSSVNAADPVNLTLQPGWGAAGGLEGISLTCGSQWGQYHLYNAEIPLTEYKGCLIEYATESADSWQLKIEDAQEHYCDLSAAQTSLTVSFADYTADVKYVDIQGKVADATIVINGFYLIKSDDTKVPVTTGSSFWGITVGAYATPCALTFTEGYGGAELLADGKSIALSAGSKDVYTIKIELSEGAPTEILLEADDADGKGFAWSYPNCAVGEKEVSLVLDGSKLEKDCAKVWVKTPAKSETPVNFAAATLEISGGTVGIDNVAVDENAPVEYYNLQGVKVANPANGIYVVRQGNKVSKVLVK